MSILAQLHVADNNQALSVTPDTFLSAFFPDEDERVDLRLLPAKGGTGSSSSIATTRRKIADEFLQHRLKKENEHLGVYFVANSGGGDDKSITRFNAFFAEIDDRSLAEQHRIFDNSPLPTSIRVETKKSVHAYWLLDGAVSREQWEDIQRRLIEYFKSDHRIKNPSRLMRLPGFNHISVKEDGGFSYKPVVVVQFNADKRYTVEQMQTAFPPAPEESRGVHSEPKTEFANWDELNTALRAKILSQEHKITKDGWVETRGICHNGVGPSGLSFNIASGAYYCKAGCSIEKILESFDLPTKPNKTIEAPPSEGKPKIITADALLRQDFPELRYAVKGLLPEGLFLLASPPKTGKTFMSLDIASAVAFGKKVLGKLDAGDAGDVLCLTLEDGERRLQQRLALIMDDAGSNRLHLATEWPRFDDGGLDQIKEWLRDHPQAKLVVIDTLQRVRPREKYGSSIYGQDYAALAPLADLAHKHRVTILVVHHTRKALAEDPFDRVSGSTGLTGAVDGTLILSRKRGATRATLSVTGRDIEERELLLERNKDTGGWLLVDDAPEEMQPLSPERREILEVYKPGMTVITVASLLGKPVNTIKQLLWKMRRDGQLPTSDNPDNHDNSGNHDNPITKQNSQVIRLPHLVTSDDLVKPFQSEADTQEVTEGYRVTSTTAVQDGRCACGETIDDFQFVCGNCIMKGG